MNAAETLATAAKLVTGNRAETYGDMSENMTRIAGLWTAYTGQKYTAQDVALMMALVKIGRIRTGRHNSDNCVDLAGYAAIAEQVFTEQNANGKEEI